MSLLQMIPAPRNPPSHAVPSPKRSNKQKSHPTQLNLWGFVEKTMSSAAPDIIEPPPTIDLQLSQDSMNKTHLANTPPDQLPEIQRPPVSLQCTLHDDPTNAPWGDALQYEKTHDYFRVLSKNISTLNTQNLDMQAIATELQ